MKDLEILSALAGKFGIQEKLTFLKKIIDSISGQFPRGLIRGDHQNIPSIHVVWNVAETDRQLAVNS